MMGRFIYLGHSLPCRGSKGPPLSAAWELRGLATSAPFGRRCPLVECVRFFILILAAPLEGHCVHSMPACSGFN